jgi:hypothetical protein
MGGFQKHSKQQAVASSSYPSQPLRSPDIIKTRQGRESENRAFVRLAYQMDALMHFEGATVNGKTLNTDPPTLQKKKRKKVVVRNNSRPSNRHAPQIRSAGSARCVQRFDDSLLQFTLLIAIRCVLHRWENQEIRCQKLFLKIRRPHYQSISL